MVIKINNKLFELDNGKVADSYVEWLAFNNQRMYDKYVALQNTTDSELYQSNLYELISNTCTAIVAVLGEDELQDVFYDMPTETADKVKKWMTKVIEFFMSYKLQILETQSVNRLDLEMNRLKDGSIFSSMYFPVDYASQVDSITSLTSQLKVSDTVRASDAVEVNAYYDNGGNE